VYTARVESNYQTERFVDVEGTQIHARLSGTDGPVVVMIHGASANAHEFDWSLAPLLSDDHRVLMVDRPGHGYSKRPKNGHTLGTQADLIAKAVAELAPDEPAVIVGHSFGGAVALRMALDRPEQVSALVLLTPVTHDWGEGGTAWYNRAVTHPVIGPVFRQLVPLVGPAQAEGGVVSVFDPAPPPEDYAQRAGLPLLFRPHVFRNNAQDVIALRDELAAQEDRYDTLDLPITVFSGALDTVISPKFHVGKLKHQADLDLVKLQNGGHMPHHTHSEDIADVIRAYAAQAASNAAE
ncbi:MAG: alpha/beta hydrolase, partial [Pseudomonadota bacterium]